MEKLIETAVYDEVQLPKVYTIRGDIRIFLLRVNYVTSALPL